MPCAICGEKIVYPEGHLNCRQCGALHCERCVEDAADRGDLSIDADCVGDPPHYVDCSSWAECLACKAVAA